MDILKRKIPVRQTYVVYLIIQMIFPYIFVALFWRDYLGIPLPLNRKEISSADTVWIEVRDRGIW
jgi:hypothetical protein